VERLADPTATVHAELAETYQALVRYLNTIPEEVK